MSGPCRIELGRLVRSVGLRGEIKLLPSADFWSASLDSRHLELEIAAGTQPVSIRASRSVGNCFVLKLEGVADREAADRLREAVLVLAGELDVPLPEQPRPFQVIGLRVRLRDGGELGEVSDLAAGPAQALLQVRGANKDYSIPWVEPIICGVDWEKGWIEIDPPEGLLEL